ncbi:MAG: beta-galactosidase [Lentisphaeria bacterium]|nr:beta-galactosidase [Lentisphaeria bacterium]
MQHYPDYPTRGILDLNGFWEFSWLGDAPWEGISPAAFRPRTVMAVPGVFDVLPSYGQRRGVGLYRKVFGDVFAVGERLRLAVDGMGLFGRIWFDGRHAGDCLLPYSGVRFDLDVRERGRHSLILAVDNRFDPERVPLFHPNYDFHAYGGIYRGVALHRLPACAVDRVQVIPLDLDAGTVRLKIALDGDFPETCPLSVAFDDGRPRHHELPVHAGRIELETRVPHCRVWSPEFPHLHTVEVAIPEDAVRERFGMRTIRTAGRDILLNGEPIELRGFNRHEAHPQLGPVQTPSQMLEDVQWLKSMGCNFVRCVHYPHDQAFLDLCDEMGLLVWAESLGWGNGAEELADPRFMDLQEQQTRLLVRNGVNHPSVILWAFLNEADSSSPQALPLYRRLTRAIREEDPSRLVSYASNRTTKDLCLDLVDVIALNGYPGWIGPVDWDTPSTAAIAPFTRRLTEFFSGDSPLADKPLIFSEIGACGLYGCHDLARSQWTEEYQADYMAAAAGAVLEDPRTRGVALWQFCDTRSYGPSGQVRTKPRGYNNAGVVDEYRRPKQAARAVADVFRARAANPQAGGRPATPTPLHEDPFPCPW